MHNKISHLTLWSIQWNEPNRNRANVRLSEQLRTAVCVEEMASSSKAFGDLLSREVFHSKTTKACVLWHPQSNPLMGLSLIWRASSLPQDRFCGEHWKPSWAMENVLNLFPAFKPGLPYQVHQSFFFFFKKKKCKCLTNLLRKNKSSQSPQRLDNFIFIV